MFAAYNLYVIIKIENFDSELQNLSETAKALSHPARLAIIK